LITTANIAIGSYSLRFHAGEWMRTDARMDYNKSLHWRKTTRSYAIRTKLSSLCNCDGWTKM